MTEIIRVKILEDGVSCREVNCLGEEPANSHHWVNTELGRMVEECPEHKEWRKYESKLRTFNIENAFPDDEFCIYVYKKKYSDNGPSVNHHLIVGSIHQAEVIDKETVRII